MVLEPFDFVDQEGQYDLNVEMKEDDRGRLVGAWKYDADLFEPESVGRLAGHFESLLREIVAQPERPVASLRLLTAEQGRAAITGARGPVMKLPPAASVCELFEARIERHPGAVAVSCGDDFLTYAELGRRVETVARGLVRRGVGRDVLVAVLLPRGLDFVTAILAVSRAGGAFLPLDPRHPWPRTAQIIDTSGTPLVLASEAIAGPAADALSDRLCRQPPSVVTFEELCRGHATELLPEVRGEDLAYVMFTSGSTGNPKGVMVEHRGMVNHVLGKISDLGLGDGDRLAQNGPQSFDIVVWQCLAALVTGGRTVVFPDDVAEDPVRLIEEVERRGVTILQVVPSMLRAVLQEAESRDPGPPPLAALRWMVPTGEALPTDSAGGGWNIIPASRCSTPTAPRSAPTTSAITG